MAGDEWKYLHMQPLQVEALPGVRARRQYISLPREEDCACAQTHAVAFP